MDDLTSLEMVAVSRPRKYPKSEQWKYEMRVQLLGRGMPASAILACCAFLYASYRITKQSSSPGITISPSPSIEKWPWTNQSSVFWLMGQ